MKFAGVPYKVVTMGVYTREERETFNEPIDITPKQQSSAVNAINAMISAPNHPANDYDPETGEIIEATAKESSVVQDNPTVAKNATIQADLPTRTAEMYQAINAGTEKGDSEAFAALFSELAAAGDTVSIGMLEEALKG